MADIASFRSGGGMKYIGAVIAACALACTLAQAEEFIKNGWANANTYRVTGTGTIGRDQDGGTPAQRQVLACEAAQLHAEGQLVERFAQARLRSVKGSVSEEAVRDGIKRRFAGTIRGGRIVWRSFDPATNECRVVYEISEKNLKARVTGQTRAKKKK